MAHSRTSHQTVESNYSDDAPISISTVSNSMQLPKISAPHSSKSNQNPVVGASDYGNVSVSKAAMSPAGGTTKPTHIPLAGQTLAAQVAMLKSQSPGSSSPILIKTSKSGDEGTYVAITIPHSTSASGSRNVIPLTIHQLKLKAASTAANLNEASTSELKGVAINALAKTSGSGDAGTSLVIQRTGGYLSSEEHGFGVTLSSQQSSSSQGMSSNFPYNDSAGLYAQTNVGSYMEGPHGAHHPSAGGQMYPSYPSQATHPGVVGVGISPQAIGVAQQAQYLQSGQASSQRVPISHTTRASPITVQWLLENYETADGVSLPRSTLYNHYLRHCADSKIDAVNAASFGKLIRSVFLGLKTRRLGTRGNSKYHYYGVRVKPNSPLARLTDDSQVALRAQPSSTKRSASGGSNSGSRPSSGHSEPASAADGHESAQHTSHRQYLGNAPGGLSDLPVLDLTDGLPDGISKQELARFGTLYRHHCEALLEVVSNLQFDLVESLWQTFWKSPAAVNKGESGTFESSDVPFETARLVAVCRCKPVQKFVKETDYILYQKIVDILVPNVLRAIPSTLTQGIRNFAKGLENILIGSMSEMPKEIVNVKVAAVSAFSQTLRRYTSLNHLAQAARAVLQNPQQINQMWTDLNKVDFTNVQEQSSWVCQCDEALIQKLEQDFKHTLGQQQSLEQWAQWLENVVSLVLGEHEGQESYPRAARQFLLNWSFYSSMIIRDLTLRSAASFGSFHLIRLLYDEYMFYLIEHKVAAFSGQSPLAVMGECVGLSTFSGGDSLNGSMNGDDDDNDDDSPDDDDDEGPLLTAPPLTQTIMMAVGQQDSMIGSRNGDELMAVGGRIGADHVMAPGFGEPELKRMKTEYMP